MWSSFHWHFLIVFHFTGIIYNLAFPWSCIYLEEKYIFSYRYPFVMKRGMCQTVWTQYSRPMLFVGTLFQHVLYLILFFLKLWSTKESIKLEWTTRITTLIIITSFHMDYVPENWINFLSMFPCFSNNHNEIVFKKGISPNASCNH